MVVILNPDSTEAEIVVVVPKCSMVPVANVAKTACSPSNRTAAVPSTAANVLRPAKVETPKGLPQALTNPATTIALPKDPRLPKTTKINSVL